MTELEQLIENQAMKLAVRSKAAGELRRLQEAFKDIDDDWMRADNDLHVFISKMKQDAFAKAAK